MLLVVAKQLGRLDNDNVVRALTVDSVPLQLASVDFVPPGPTPGLHAAAVPFAAVSEGLRRNENHATMERKVADIKRQSRLASRQLLRND